MTDAISATASAATATRAASGPTGTDAAAASGDSAVLSSDFETFLRMLTAQVQNQDPLNPLDSTDFAVQLATFSNVEQQVRTNVLLQDLSETMGATGSLTDMASYVGKEARVAAPPRFEGAPLEFQTAPAPSAASAQLRVYNGEGRLLDWQAIDPLGGPVTWTGERPPEDLTENPLDADKRLPAGDYSYEVVSYDSGNRIIDTSTPGSFMAIEEARRGEGGIELKLADGRIVPETDILALRNP